MADFKTVLRALDSMSVEELHQAVLRCRVRKNELAGMAKAELDALREEWDRVDNAADGGIRQFRINKKIEQAQKRLQELTGETY